MVPTQLLILATYLKKLNNIDASFLDLSQKFGIRNREEIISKYLDNFSDYPFFGITCPTSNFYLDCLFLAKKIREFIPSAYIIIGGHHPTVRPKDFLFKKSPFNFIFSGEAEIELSKLIKKITIIEKHPKKPKIIYCNPINKKDFINTDWKYAESFDFIKNPNQNNFVIFPVFLSRGCSFKCNFCTDPNNKLTSCYKIRRLFPYDKAIKELTFIYDLFHNKKKITYEVNISDPIFGNPHFRKKIYKDLIESAPDQYYAAEIRVDTFQPDMEIPSLKQLKFYLSFGLESGSPEMLTIMNKTKMPRKYLYKMKEIAEKLDRNSIYYVVNILLGHPGENNKTLVENSKYLKDLVREKRFLIPQFIKYMLHPGSEIYSNMKKYKKKYGTRFLLKEWWKEEINQLKISQLVNPSSELHCIKLYYEIQKLALKIYKLIAANKIGRRPDMRAMQQNFYRNILEQINIWKKAPEEFENFIRDKVPKFLPLI